MLLNAESRTLRLELSVFVIENGDWLFVVQTSNLDPSKVPSASPTNKLQYTIAVVESTLIISFVPRVAFLLILKVLESSSSIPI